MEKQAREGREWKVVVAGALFGVALGAGAQAPAWRPEKAVELISSSAPGGSNDKTGRAIQKIPQDDKILAVPVNVVNKPGGNKTLARAYVNMHSHRQSHARLQSHRSVSRNESHDLEINARLTYRHYIMCGIHSS